MSIVTISRKNDKHADIMHRCLSDCGFKSTLIFDEEFPTERSFSVFPQSDTISTLANPDLLSADVIWNRKIGTSYIDDALHADDRPVAKKICDRFVRDIRNLDLAEWTTGTWVNPHSVQLQYENKINQIRIAQNVGFIVPDTLISNNPDDIRTFSNRYRSCVVKPYYPMVWNDEDEVQLATPTSILPDSDELNDLSLQYSPMIYQENILRSYDLRVVVFGNQILAVKIAPLAHLKKGVDWRPSSFGDAKLELIELPVNVIEMITQLCQKIGILHCSFDFGVTPSGDVVFFEFNVQGQWLWIELFNPNIRMLRNFVKMIADLSTEQGKSIQEVSAADYL